MAFNKLFVMGPAFLLARSLDGEDPSVIFYVRLLYGIVQFCCLSVALYTFIQANKIANEKKNDDASRLIYVPPPPTPFADPTATTGKKYTQYVYGAYVFSTARSLFFSTLFGICMTVGLHIYKGMLMGMAIQVAMAPFNIIENALVKALLLGNGIRLQDKIFEEKLLNELNDDDEIQDEQGNVLLDRRPNSLTTTTGTKNTSSSSSGAASTTSSSSVSSSLEEVLLDVWDMGANADISNLMTMLNKKNSNYQTVKDGWTPLMILAGLGGSGSQVKGTTSAIRQLLSDYGADIVVKDNEGWNALHWAAFHNSFDAAKELIAFASKQGSNQEQILLAVKDKDGNSPAETARKEGNDKIAKLYEECMAKKAATATTPADKKQK